MAADLNTLKQDLTRRMDGAVETLRREFNGLRTGRAHPGLLEPVRVMAYGTEMPLNQIATVHAPEPQSRIAASIAAASAVNSRSPRSFSRNCTYSTPPADHSVASRTSSSCSAVLSRPASCVPGSSRRSVMA